MRKLKTWVLRAVISLGALIALQATVLAFPALWFAESERMNRVTVYSDSPIDESLRVELVEIEARLAAQRIGLRAGPFDLFLCSSSTLYAFFARLAFVPSHVPGFNLSLFDNSFISLPGINERAGRTGGYPDYSAIGGDLVHAAVHELMHDLMVSELGFFENLQAPVWKREGYCEYASEAVFAPQDSGATLAERFGYALSLPEGSRAREYLLWQLTVQYLAEIEGKGFWEIMDGAVELESSQRDALSWRAAFAGGVLRFENEIPHNPVQH